MDDTDLPDTADLDRIAHALDVAPGPDGRGLTPEMRSALFAYLDAPDYLGWQNVKRLQVSRRHTLWVATMRHAHVGMYSDPTRESVLSTLEALGAGTVRP